MAQVPPTKFSRKDFLPVSMADLNERGISELDFVFVSGDCYVDHASFAPALPIPMPTEEKKAIALTEH